MRPKCAILLFFKKNQYIEYRNSDNKTKRGHLCINQGLHKTPTFDPVPIQFESACLEMSLLWCAQSIITNWFAFISVALVLYLYILNI